MNIEIERGGETDGTVYLDTFCGNYCFRIRHVRINDKSMVEWLQLAEALDWIADDRCKLFIFIMVLKGMSREDAFNAVFTKKCLKNGIYINLYNAGRINEENYKPKHRDKVGIKGKIRHSRCKV